MSNQLQESLDTILKEKNTKLLPENLKAGITCLGVTGKLQEGIDTSDATAIDSDIARDKTAYVNGEKIRGTVNTIDAPNNAWGSLANFMDYDTYEPNTTLVQIAAGEDCLIRQGAKLETTVPYDFIVQACEITGDKIVSGNTILGVEGTYVPPKTLSNIVPDSALVLLHFDGDNINTITGNATGITSVSVYRDPKFGTKSAQASGFAIHHFTGVPTYTELVNGTAELTVSFWAYLQNTVGKLIFSAKQSDRNNTAFAIQQSNTTALNVNGTIIEIGSHLPNKWHHYGIIIKNGTLTVYFDGVNIYNQGILSGSGTIPLRLLFGETDTAILRIDEVLVCNEAIYTENFVPLEVPYELPPVDTSDATATAEDIALYKTAYIKGEKVTGTAWDGRGTAEEMKNINLGEATWDYDKTSDWIQIRIVPNGATIIDNTTNVVVDKLASDMANLIGLTGDKIVSGNTILGVEGTAEVGGSSSLEINDCTELFYNSHRLNEMNKILSYCKNITLAEKMFSNCYNLTSVDVSTVTTSGLSTMKQMFYSCRKLTSITFGDFDTSSVTTMYSLFYGCNALSSIDISKFNTANVNDMYGMFGGCSALEIINLSNFDTSNVTSMCYMFADCSKLTSLNISSFDTRKVTNFMQMFLNCSMLTDLDLSNFTVEQATNMNQMFSGCKGLLTLNLKNWVVPTSATTSNMFANVPANCEIKVSSQEVADWILSIRSDFTNIIVE